MRTKYEIIEELGNCEQARKTRVAAFERYSKEADAAFRNALSCDKRISLLCAELHEAIALENSADSVLKNITDRIISETKMRAFYQGQELIDILEYSSNPDDPCAQQMITGTLANGKTITISTNDKNLKIERSRQNG